MTQFAIEDKKELKPRISVIGVGGAGGNAVNNMIRGDLQGVKFIACNTDAQALSLSLAESKIQLGFEATQGLGAGSHPEVGRISAEESIHEVATHIDESNMLFVTAGMGGGTGTGAAPVIAKAARERGILTVGVVTKPFHFEGSNRMRTAEKGIEELQKYVDTLIIIPNQNLFRVANEKTTFADAFKMADDVLYSGVRSITDLMMKPGLINLDFADVRAVMGEMMGKAMMGTGEAQGDGRAIEAAEAAISSPLLDDVSMRGAKAVLINITGGLDMTLYEVDEAANRIREEIDPDAHIIFGSTFDEALEGRIRVSCVATGIDAQAASLLSKARISELEKEMQETAVKVEEEINSQPHVLFDKEGVNTDAGFEGNVIQLNEVAAFGSAEISIESSARSTPTERMPAQPAQMAFSLFGRLMGRKGANSRPKETFEKSTAETTVQARSELFPEDEDESMDIPAFLRRQSGNKST